MLAAFGHAVLTLGFAIGFLDALRARNFSLLRDPKVLPALVAWSIYAATLGLRWAARWRGRTG